ncbi:MAG: amidohydrolase [Spirochaetaceae bacterium]|jgi:amidohydrolase|nr:amidohydrolase [Spirochaetaceae bacterium]
MDRETLAKRLLAEFEWLHSHPELSYAEFETTAHIRAALLEAGIAVLDTPLATGLVAEIHGGRTGATVALRADIDALPINEESGVAYSSIHEGRMHACGHDFHTSGLLGAALLLQERRKNLAGAVRLLFQPAEEVSGGAAGMIAAGGLDGVEEIYGLHVMPNLKSGVVAVTEGATFAATLKFSIRIQGKGGHAAMPELCADPIVAAAALISSAQTIVSRNTGPFESVVVSCTHIEAGTAWNIIPDTAFIEGTIRALGTEKCAAASEKLNAVCRGTEKAFNVTIAYTPENDAPSTNNDAILCDFIRNVAADSGYQVTAFQPTMGGEDFALYQQKVPGVFFCFGVESPYALHHPKFTAKTDNLAAAALLLARIAEQALERLAAGSRRPVR